jgi:autotransporter-associated beta strand protein
MPAMRVISFAGIRRLPLNPMKRPHLRLLRLEERAVPAIATWDGGGINFNNVWTTAANWVGDIAPMPGDDLVFPSGAQQLTNINDFADGTAFGSITVTGHSYNLTGNAVLLNGKFNVNFDDGAIDPINPALHVQFSLNMGAGPLEISVNNRIAEFTGGLITGSNGLVKNGAGMLILGMNNTYTGVTHINEGVVRIGNYAALGAIGGGNGTIIDDGATLDLAGDNITVAEPISFSGRGVDRTNINGKIVSAGAISIVQGFDTLSGPLTLTGNGMISGEFGERNITITNGIREAGGSFKLEIGPVGQGLIFSPTAVNTFTGGTTATFNVRYDGQDFSAVTVTNGILSGKGTIGPLTSTAGAYVNPSFGGLTTSDLNLGGNTSITLEAQDFGRLVVHGTVNLSGQLFAHANFTVRPTGLYRIIDNDGTDPVVGTFLNLPEGDVLRYIDNDATDPVVGTFAGLPEGAIVPDLSQPVPLRISYHGGDGNDVVLVGASQTASAAAAGPGGKPRVNV